MGVSHFYYTSPAQNTNNNELATGSEGGEIQQNITFVDEMEGNAVNFNPIKDNSFYNDHIADASLGDFLGRPALINTFTWNQGSIVNTSFNPWADYFNTASIKRKIDNFAYLSCNLKIKFMINSSPFYYGAMLCSYRPLTSFDPAPITSTNNRAQLLGHSTRPHVYLYPQYNQGAEMSLPFVYHKNWLTVSDASEFDDMGTIVMKTAAVLASANGAASTSVDINVYAWAEDIRVSVPTSALAMQSEDEYGKGVVSEPASQIADFASKIYDIVPYTFKPFVLATQMISHTVAGVASMFGFTNVPVIEDSMPFKSVPFHAFASSDIGEPIDKLTLSAKNELCVDPRTAGLSPIDELNISYIASKQCLVDEALWTESQAPETLLWSSRVVPSFTVFNVEAAPTQTVVSRSPIAFVSKFFKYWRGDIEFEIKLVSTIYHKGRLRLSWDPTANIQSLVTTASSETNTTVFNRIVDVSTENVARVVIPYAQATAWLETYQPTESDAQYGEGVCDNRDSNQDNGVFTIRVFNSLSSPTGAAPVVIMISIRGGPNLEFACFGGSKGYLYESPFRIQSHDMIDGEDNVYIGGSKSAAAKDHMVYMGEVIPSLRSVMRRRSYQGSVMSSIGTTNTSGNSYHVSQWFLPRTPLSYGYDPTGRDTALNTTSAATVRFNNVNTTPVTEISSCYVGRRGSYNWYFNSMANTSPTTFAASRSAIQPLSWDTLTTYLTTLSNTAPLLISNKLLQVRDWMHEGSSLTNVKTQAGLAVVVPNYSKFRFQSTNPEHASLGVATDGSDYDGMFIESITQTRPTAVNSEFLDAIDRYVSIGTDYSVFMFLNVPTVYEMPLVSANGLNVT